MRRLLRILLNVATVLSLLLFLATVVLWVRNYWRSDYVIFRSGDRAHSLILKDGVMQWKSVQYRHRYVNTPKTLKAHSFSKNGHPVSSQDPFFAYESEFQIVFDPVGWLDPTRCGFAAGEKQRLYPGNRTDIYDDDETKPDFRYRYASVPMWAPPALFLILPARCGWSWLKRRRRARTGLCPGCGYDLRATPDRCPECGRAVAPSPTGER